jgi:hypothetical protein
MKNIKEALEERFFSDFEEEEKLISDSLSCLKMSDFLKLMDKYGEKKVFGLLSTDFKTNVKPRLIFFHLKSIRSRSNFI